ncbi:MAG: transporter substrate-binding domain-containing protein [Chloroflexi bacterium]|nr:transporter substrate-binding domain-containing protein [Chloroflexota bacterium]
MTFRKLLFLMTLALVLVVAGACAAQPTPTARPTETAAPTDVPTEEATSESAALPDLEGRTVTVAVENAYPPFNSIDPESGEAVGWDYDAVGEICARLNCVPEFIQTSWDGMLVAIANGEFDMAADGITITAERDETVDFSMGYMTVEQAILVRADEERFSTAEELAADTSLIIGSQTGTTNYDVAVELVGAERVQAFDLFPVAVQALIAGDVDAVIMDNTAGLGYVGANPESVKIVGSSLRSDALGFAFPPGSELVAAVNAALESMIADGTLQEINARWFVPAEPAAEEEAPAEATEAAAAEATATP